MKFGRLMQNNMPIMQDEVEVETGKRISVWLTYVCFSKPEIVISQPRIELS